MLKVNFNNYFYTFVYTIVDFLEKIEHIFRIKESLSLSKKATINLLYTYGFVNNKLNDVLKPFDISIQQFNVLRILRGQSGNPVSLKIVQERMINKMSNTTRLIDKLIKKSYVKKSINKTNRRKIDITITSNGLEFLNKIDEIIENTEKKIIQSLTEDETQELIRLLGKIRLIAN